ncbi:MAG TPA: P22 phage major capsid protein family protein, partial [Verrucomicrobiae bacterium]|nr:P22 phage major capsid protein family protein [Verrucomicrobiae bacterium]
MTVTAAADQTIGTKSLVVDNYKSVGFNWTGEEEFGINTGPRMERIIVDQLAQCFRSHANAIESFVWGLGYIGASRAIGTTAGTAPVLADFAGAKKILDDNGAPASDRSVVIDTTAGVALRGTSNLYKVNEAGDSGLLRNGTLGNLYGFGIRESAAIVPVTAGTMASATSTAAAFTVGQTLIPLATAGTGLVSAGDIITFANDTNKYLVASVSFAGANPASGDTITLAEPGLRKAQASATRAITVFATSTRNIAMSRNAITLATRLPKYQNGDQATDRQVITDPVSGISFELSMWPGQRMVKYEVAIA